MLTKLWNRQWRRLTLPNRVTSLMTSKYHRSCRMYHIVICDSVLHSQALFGATIDTPVSTNVEQRNFLSLTVLLRAILCRAHHHNKFLIKHSAFMHVLSSLLTPSFAPSNWNIFFPLFCRYLTLVANRPYLLAHLTLNITKLVHCKCVCVSKTIWVFVLYPYS